MADNDEVAIRVNFGRPFALFPLDSAMLMPHAGVPVHIFEERYRQMVREALDGPGQIALAVYDESGLMDDHGRPLLRDAVCVGQILQHHQLPDGRYNLLLHGICRARIVQETPPDEDRLYRTAYLEPVGLNEVAEEEIAPSKARLLELLSQPPLTDLRKAEELVGHLQDDEIPTSAVMEVVTVVMLDDAEIRYQLLAEGDLRKRMDIVEEELVRLRRLLVAAAPQRRTDLPKGVNYN